MASTPLSDGRCLLLSIPRELRDEIYEYALSEDNGLTVQPTNNGFKLWAIWHKHDEEVRRDPTPLKLVCHQLYEETKDLVLKLNPLLFSSTDTVRGTKLFTNFIQNGCSPTNHQLIKKVIIREGTHHDVDLSAGFQGFVSTKSPSVLFSFCRSHPNTSVIIYLAEFNSKFPSWWCMLLGTMVQKALGGEDLIPTFRQNLWGTLSFNSGVMTRVLCSMPKNLRLFPATKLFDEQTFRKDIVWLYSYVDPEHGVEAWVQQARKWCEKGF
ncbi:uncharacterized protein BDR25DRAFT_309095 [Lindgomyces ingoldianus]|uniref:Uncharacterized protein n=1 Tax=Lindgomyces ingoldianus TaxID=673940 RepID=A0ACB6RG74_9PLEO|nr:uncharacterized protein BDR25DRAFT_309095 [Lindgomyces ingoldianus]KAF2478323.1 hypothetical protein BDR25DRAFT_309095 [Lindgomyces ingoldianus]